MIRIHGFQPQRHRQFELDAIAVLPGAPDGGESSRLYRTGDSSPLTESTGSGVAQPECGHRA